MKAAIVHDWLTGMRGGEKCLEVFCELLPDADLCTLLHIRGSMSPTIEKMKIHTSFLQNLPFAQRRYRYYLPLFPRAIERFDFTHYDLILSSSHCVAKGAAGGRDTVHICYCYTPMRYVWDMYEQYFGRERTSLPLRMFIGTVARRLRKWDVGSSSRVHHFIAISNHVRERIKRHYRREADVIYPPVDCSFFDGKPKQGDFFLVVSAFAPYKRIDLAIQAFNDLRLPLVVVGSGQDEARLKGLAASNISFRGAVSDQALRDVYLKCRALIFPGEEDFGIVPLEAMACGRPVIAFKRGGALETVTEETGILFESQTPDAIIEAVRRFEQREDDFAHAVIRQRALEFDRPIFKAKIQSYLAEKAGVLPAH